MANNSIIHFLITLIVWYYCLLNSTINAQSFSVLFGRNYTSSILKSSGYGSRGSALYFIHERTTSYRPSHSSKKHHLRFRFFKHFEGIWNGLFIILLSQVVARRYHCQRTGILIINTFKEMQANHLWAITTAIDTTVIILGLLDHRTAEHPPIIPIKSQDRRTEVICTMAADHPIDSLKG